MSSMLATVLPPHEGILPKWLLLVSLISVMNSFQAYSTQAFTRRVYSLSPSSVTPLSARTFGTWTFLSSVIRLYAAYNIENAVVYQLALWTYVIAWLHFVSEWQVYKTAQWGAGLAGPAVVATGSLIWMGAQWGYYVNSY